MPKPIKIKRNRRPRRERLISFLGFELLPSQWALITELPIKVIQYRIAHGWDPGQAITTQMYALPGPTRGIAEIMAGWTPEEVLLHRGMDWHGRPLHPDYVREALSRIELFRSRRAPPLAPAAPGARRRGRPRRQGAPGPIASSEATSAPRGASWTSDPLTPDEQAARQKAPPPSTGASGWDAVRHIVRLFTWRMADVEAAAVARGEPVPVLPGEPGPVGDLFPRTI